MSTAFLRLPGIRLFALGFLALLLLIPLSQVRELINERSQRAREAEAGIAAPWGQAQLVAASYLSASVPTQVSNGTTLLVENHPHALLADALKVDARLGSETRRRGMFSVPVYTSTLHIQSRFLAADIAAMRARADAKAPIRLHFALSDAKGVRAVSNWRVNGLALRPAAGGSDLGELQSLAVDVPAEMLDQDLQVEIEATVAGTRRLQFLPLARDTQVSVQGSWADPGFIGAFLPAQRNISPQGFDARWQVLEFNRRYAQSCAHLGMNAPMLAESAFGVDLYQPASVYQQNERSGKYGLLIIVLVFAALFLFEVLGRLALHPVQYLLFGTALALFYLLLLALSEHLGFDLAYVIAAVTAVLLVGGYARAVLATGTRALLLVALQVAAYGVFYVLVTNEDFALLLGAAALTTTLALVMFLTRRTNWHAVGR